MNDIESHLKSDNVCFMLLVKCMLLVYVLICFIKHLKRLTQMFCLMACENIF